MPGMAAAICARSVALPWTAWLGPPTSAFIDKVVSGAVTRSCRTASGRVCHVKTASVAATAAATSVVSPAAASTIQCSVIRRVAIGPRGLIIGAAFRYSYFSANDHGLPGGLPGGLPRKESYPGALVKSQRWLSWLLNDQPTTLERSYRLP